MCTRTHGSLFNRLQEAKVQLSFFFIKIRSEGMKIRIQKKWEIWCRQSQNRLFSSMRHCSHRVVEVMQQKWRSHRSRAQSVALTSGWFRPLARSLRAAVGILTGFIMFMTPVIATICFVLLGNSRHACSWQCCPRWQIQTDNSHLLWGNAASSYSWLYLLSFVMFAVIPCCQIYCVSSVTSLHELTADYHNEKLSLRLFVPIAMRNLSFFFFIWLLR